MHITEQVILSSGFVLNVMNVTSAEDGCRVVSFSWGLAFSYCWIALISRDAAHAGRLGV